MIPSSLRCLAFGLATLFGATALAQPAANQYPDRPIRLIVPYPPGSGTDTIARYAARQLEGAFDKPVVVENRPGGNAIIAAQAVINAAPDGYTLLWAANGPVTTNVALYDKLPYDPLTDLLPVARLAFAPMGLFVPQGSPHRSAQDLFAAAKARPLALNYASGSATYNIATEWLLSLAGAQATNIPYKGAAPAIADLGSGQVDFSIVEFSAAAPLMQAGKIELLAVTSDRRVPAAPDVPTLQELGYPDYFQVAWWAVFAPRGTPEGIVAKLEKTLLEIFAKPETLQYLANSNYSAFPGTGAELRQYQEAEIRRESKLVEQFGIPKM